MICKSSFVHGLGSQFLLTHSLFPLFIPKPQKYFMQGSKKLDCIFCIVGRVQKLGWYLNWVWVGSSRINRVLFFSFFSWQAIYLTRISPENKYLDDVQFRLEILPLVVEIQRLYFNLLQPQPLQRGVSCSQEWCIGLQDLHNEEEMKKE